MPSPQLKTQFWGNGYQAFKDDLSFRQIPDEFLALFETLPDDVQEIFGPEDQARLYQAYVTNLNEDHAPKLSIPQIEEFLTGVRGRIFVSEDTGIDVDDRKVYLEAFATAVVLPASRFEPGPPELFLELDGLYFSGEWMEANIAVLVAGQSYQSAVVKRDALMTQKQEAARSMAELVNRNTGYTDHERRDYWGFIAEEYGNEQDKLHDAERELEQIEPKIAGLEQAYLEAQREAVLWEYRMMSNAGWPAEDRQKFLEELAKDSALIPDELEEEVEKAAARRVNESSSRFDQVYWAALRDDKPADEAAAFAVASYSQNAALLDAIDQYEDIAKGPFVIEEHYGLDWDRLPPALKDWEAAYEREQTQSLPVWIRGDGTRTGDWVLVSKSSDGVYQVQPAGTPEDHLADGYSLPKSDPDTRHTDLHLLSDVEIPFDDVQQLRAEQVVNSRNLGLALSTHSDLNNLVPLASELLSHWGVVQGFITEGLTGYTKDAAYLPDIKAAADDFLHFYHENIDDLDAALVQAKDVLEKLRGLDAGSRTNKMEAQVRALEKEIGKMEKAIYDHSYVTLCEKISDLDDDFDLAQLVPWLQGEGFVLVTTIFISVAATTAVIALMGPAGLGIVGTSTGGVGSAIFNQAMMIALTTTTTATTQVAGQEIAMDLSGRLFDNGLESQFSRYDRGEITLDELHDGYRQQWIHTAKISFGISVAGAGTGAFAQWAYASQNARLSAMGGQILRFAKPFDKVFNQLAPQRGALGSFARSGVGRTGIESVNETAQEFAEDFVGDMASAASKELGPWAEYAVGFVNSIDGRNIEIELENMGVAYNGLSLSDGKGLVTYTYSAENQGTIAARLKDLFPDGEIQRMQSDTPGVFEVVVGQGRQAQRLRFQASDQSVNLRRSLGNRLKQDASQGVERLMVNANTMMQDVLGIEQEGHELERTYRFREETERDWTLEQFSRMGMVAFDEGVDARGTFLLVDTGDTTIKVYTQAKVAEGKPAPAPSARPGAAGLTEAELIAMAEAQAAAGDAEHEYVEEPVTPASFPDAQENYADARASVMPPGPVTTAPDTDTAGAVLMAPSSQMPAYVTRQLQEAPEPDLNIGELVTSHLTELAPDSLAQRRYLEGLQNACLDVALQDGHPHQALAFRYLVQIVEVAQNPETNIEANVVAFIHGSVLGRIGHGLPLIQRYGVFESDLAFYSIPLHQFTNLYKALAFIHEPENFALCVQGYRFLAASAIGPQRVIEMFAFDPINTTQALVEIGGKMEAVERYIAEDGSIDVRQAVADSGLPLYVHVYESAGITAAQALAQQLGLSEQDNIGLFPEQMFTPDYSEGRDLSPFQRVSSEDLFGDEDLRVGLNLHSGIERQNGVTRSSIEPFKYFPVGQEQDTQDVHERLGIPADRPVIILGSPAQDETAAILKSYQRDYANTPPDERPLLIIAPARATLHHRNHVAALREDFRVEARVHSDKSATSETWTALGKPASELDIILLETRGELSDLYTGANLAIIGKDRNFFEPLSRRTPTFIISDATREQAWPHNSLAYQATDSVMRLGESGGYSLDSTLPSLLENPHLANDNDRARQKIEDSLPVAATLVALNIALQTLELQESTPAAPLATNGNPPRHFAGDIGPVNNFMTIWRTSRYTQADLQAALAAMTPDQRVEVAQQLLDVHGRRAEEAFFPDVELQEDWEATHGEEEGSRLFEEAFGEALADPYEMLTQIVLPLLTTDAERFAVGSRLIDFYRTDTRPVTVTKRSHLGLVQELCRDFEDSRYAAALLVDTIGSPLISEAGFRSKDARTIEEITESADGTTDLRNLIQNTWEHLTEKDRTRVLNRILLLLSNASQATIHPHALFLLRDLCVTNRLTPDQQQQVIAAVRLWFDGNPQALFARPYQRTGWTPRAVMVGDLFVIDPAIATHVANAFREPGVRVDADAEQEVLVGLLECDLGPDQRQEIATRYLEVVGYAPGSPVNFETWETLHARLHVLPNNLRQQFLRDSLPNLQDRLADRRQSQVYQTARKQDQHGAFGPKPFRANHVSHAESATLARAMRYSEVLWQDPSLITPEIVELYLDLLTNNEIGDARDLYLTSEEAVTKTLEGIAHLRPEFRTQIWDRYIALWDSDINMTKRSAVVYGMGSFVRMDADTYAPMALAECTPGYAYGSAADFANATMLLTDIERKSPGLIPLDTLFELHSQIVDAETPLADTDYFDVYPRKIKPTRDEVFLAEIIERRAWERPQDFEASHIAELESRWGDESSAYVVAYLANHSQTQASTRDAAIANLEVRRARGQLPLQEFGDALFESGPVEVLIAYDLKEGFGDQLIRINILMQALLAKNPDLKITLVTKRAHAFEHPRVTVVAAKSRTEVPDGNYDAVFNFGYLERQPRILDDEQSEFLPPVTDQVAALKDEVRLYVYSVVGASTDIPHQHGIAQVWKDGEPITRESDWLYRPLHLHNAMYSPTYRLTMALGLDVQDVHQIDETNTTLSLPEDREPWDNILQQNTGGKPVAVVHPLGNTRNRSFEPGLVPIPGYQGFDDYRYSLENLNHHIETLVAQGYFVVLAPIFGKSSWVAERNHLLGELATRHDANDVAALPDLATLPTGTLNLVAAEADILITADGGMMHAASMLGQSDIYVIEGTRAARQIWYGPNVTVIPGLDLAEEIPPAIPSTPPPSGPDGDKDGLGAANNEMGLEEALMYARMMSGPAWGVAGADVMVDSDQPLTNPDDDSSSGAAAFVGGGSDRYTPVDTSDILDDGTYIAAPIDTDEVLGESDADTAFSANPHVAAVQRLHAKVWGTPPNPAEPADIEQRLERLGDDTLQTALKIFRRIQGRKAQEYFLWLLSGESVTWIHEDVDHVGLQEEHLQVAVEFLDQNEHLLGTSLESMILDLARSKNAGTMTEIYSAIALMSLPFVEVQEMNKVLRNSGGEHICEIDIVMTVTHDGQTYNFRVSVKYPKHESGKLGDIQNMHSKTDPRHTAILAVDALPRKRRSAALTDLAIQSVALQDIASMTADEFVESWTEYTTLHRYRAQAGHPSSMHTHAKVQSAMAAARDFDASDPSPRLRVNAHHHDSLVEDPQTDLLLRRRRLSGTSQQVLQAFATDSTVPEEVRHHVVPWALSSDETTAWEVGIGMPIGIISNPTLRHALNYVSYHSLAYGRNPASHDELTAAETRIRGIRTELFRNGYDYPVNASHAYVHTNTGEVILASLERMTMVPQGLDFENGESIGQAFAAGYPLTWLALPALEVPFGRHDRLSLDHSTAPYSTFDGHFENFSAVYGDFNGSRFSETTFVDSDLTGTDIGNSNFYRSYFIDTNMTNTLLDFSSGLETCIFYRTLMTRANYEVLRVVTRQPELRATQHPTNDKFVYVSHNSGTVIANAFTDIAQTTEVESMPNYHEYPPLRQVRRDLLTGAMDNAKTDAQRHTIRGLFALYENLYQGKTTDEDIMKLLQIRDAIMYDEDPRVEDALIASQDPDHPRHDEFQRLMSVYKNDFLTTIYAMSVD